MQPARGTELVTITHVNMPNEQSQEVFVENGLLVYVTMYHKGIWHAGAAKVIHRYLPREVGELLFYYLWMLLPFWQKLERTSGRVIDARPSPCIWEPIREERWTGLLDNDLLSKRKVLSIASNRYRVLASFPVMHS